MKRNVPRYFNVDIGAELFGVLAAIAKQEDRSVGSILRLATRRYLAERAGQPLPPMNAADEPATARTGAN